MKEKWNAKCVVLETSGVGAALGNALLKREGARGWFCSNDPALGKVERATAQTPKIERKRVYLPTTAPWLETFEIRGRDLSKFEVRRSGRTRWSNSSPCSIIATVGPLTSQPSASTASSRSDGIVTALRACGVLGGRVAHADEQDQLQRVSIPARDHSASDLALPPLHPQPARRRGLVGGTRSGGVLRDRSALGEPFRTDDRGRPTKASPEASHDLASRRGLSENRRPYGLSLAGRRRS